jgi:hypothetical protein
VLAEGPYRRVCPYFNLSGDGLGGLKTLGALVKEIIHHTVTGKTAISSGRSCWSRTTRRSGSYMEASIQKI